MHSHIPRLWISRFKRLLQVSFSFVSTKVPPPLCRRCLEPVPFLFFSVLSSSSPHIDWILLVSHLSHLYLGLHIPHNTHPVRNTLCPHLTVQSVPLSLKFTISLSLSLSLTLSLLSLALYLFQWLVWWSFLHTSHKAPRPSILHRRFFHSRSSNVHSSLSI